MKRAEIDDTKFEGIQAINSTFDADHAETLSEEYLFREAIEKGDVHMICLRRKYQSEKIQLLSESLHDKIFCKVADIILNQRRDHPDQFIMVLFSESFFANTDPLDNQVVYSIVEKCKELSTQNRVLVQFCLLHKFNIDERPYWLQGKYNHLNSRRKIKKRIINMNSDLSASNFLIANRWHRGRIANYTLSIYEGKIAAIYRKSTYCNAANFWIPLRERKAIYAYEFGDFRAHLVEGSSIPKIFTGEKPLIAIRMCSDMNDPHLDSTFTKLAIIHSNDHPALPCKNLSLPSLFIDDAHGFELIRRDKTIVGTKITEDSSLPGDCCVCHHFDLNTWFNSTNSVFKG